MLLLSTSKRSLQMLCKQETCRNNCQEQTKHHHPTDADVLYMAAEVEESIALHSVHRKIQSCIIQLKTYISTFSQEIDRTYSCNKI